MSVKSQLNSTETSWILRLFVTISLGVATVSLGWFLREGAYIRDRLDAVESSQQRIERGMVEDGDVRQLRALHHEDAESLRASIQQVRDSLLELERLVQTKADAREIRSELVRSQEILNERIRQIEQGRDE